MRFNLSISLRLTLWFSAIFLCLFVVFGAFIWFDLSSSLSSGRDRTLGRRSDRMADLLKHMEGDSADLQQTKYRDFVEATPEGKMIQAYLLDGKRLLPPASAANADFPWPKVPSTTAEYRSDVWIGDHPYRVFVRSDSFNGQPIRIFVAGSLSDNQGLLDRTAEILERSIPPMLLISALAGYFISRRALKPVVRITESARSITIGNLASRLPVSPNGDELAKLADTCNEMLSRLEQAVKRITQFTSDASHELRSPITFIRTTSEYALRTPGLNAEAIDAFKNILNEAEHSSRLIEDMLLLARSDAGRAQIVFEPVYMAEIVLQVATRMRVLAREKRQQLVDRVSDIDLQLSGDPLLLRRLVWILLDNSIKYTPCDGSIEISLVRNEQYVLLTVSDNGIGIPEGSLPHIFDRFFRADISRGEQEGTGLGLAIGKWIAEAHRAVITARKLNPAGTAFEVSFPLNGNQHPV
jgi:heavy metal sensor kinase